MVNPKRLFQLKIQNIINQEDFDLEEYFKITKEFEEEGQYNIPLLSKLAAEACGIKNTNLRNKKSKGKSNFECATARSFCFAYLRKKSNGKLIFRKIGGFYKRNHATVLHGLTQLNNMFIVKDKYVISSYQRFKELIEEHKEYL